MFSLQADHKLHEGSVLCFLAPTPYVTHLIVVEARRHLINISWLSCTSSSLKLSRLTTKGLKHRVFHA